ncbi:hypothetical protein NW837_05445 [Synechococcus sp. R6-10]|uniref:hypothetical protein n=1 Tax=Synechococcus sp. R6-10 TaxID=2291956 RepID=UPI0039C24B23
MAFKPGQLEQWDPMYVYCPEEVLEAGAPYNLEELIERLEQGDRTLLSRLFDVRYPYWKRNLRRNVRLVADLRYLGEVPVLVLFGLWGRGSHEYREFLERRQDPSYQERVRNWVSDDQLQAWLAQRQAENEQEEARQNQLLPLPNELYDWTQFLNTPNRQERLVLESGEWVRQVQALSLEQRRQVYRAVEQFIIGDEKGNLYWKLPLFYPETEVRCWREGSIHLAISLVQVCEQEKVLSPFLIGVYDHAPEQRERFDLGRRTCLFGRGADQPDILQHPQSLEIWKRYARRAYPNYMVADENVWLEIQETTEGNLALSMEEEEILQSTSMPLLINGRAGSGKSLMLYYRFADYCSHYLKDSSKGSFQYRPLFLTYSPSLVQQARSKVSTILRVNHRYRERGSDFSEGEIERCQAFFSTFQDYLLSCLPPERQERYQPERYVNFYRFRSWYRGRSDVELAWHTIRTLIKGYGVSDYLDPDCYRELPQADRTVNVEVFDRIYEQVWPGYQERTTYGSYWDDQDLARDVLQNGFLRSIHPVIFCDEVQDFTQLELNIVFCLSPWGKYKLDWAIERLPYAFAGDPLQTINPTGFRWGALRRYLYEHIHAYLLPGHSLEIPSPRELKNNYRCSPQITRFSNLINLWRRVLSNDRGICPQQPWRFQEPGRPAQKFVLDGQDKNLTQHELRSMLRNSTGTVCILPCSIGEELDYVRQDPDLQRVFAEELEQNLKPALLQTVTAVKGMEFKKIILYKFGDCYRQNFSRRLNHYAQEAAEKVSLQLHYFLNQLYVGITRPIEALAVVDTAAGWREFWDPALEIDFWLNHSHLQPDRSQWQTHPPVLAGFAQGTGIQYWTDKNLQDVLDLALGFLRQGVEEGNPELLEDARAFARQAGNQKLEQECQAWILKLQRDYVSAGRQFLSLERSALPNRNLIREAWECFWKAKAWSELQQHRSTHFARCSEIPNYGPLVDLMVVTQSSSAKSMERFRQIVRVRDWLSVEVSPKHSDLTWKVCVEKFLAELEEVFDNLGTFCPKPEDRELFWQETLEALRERLAFLGQRQPFAGQYHKILGICYFQQQKLEEAVAIWDQGGQTEHSRYYRAKIQLEKPPGQVRWLSKDRQDAAVVSKWQEAGRPLAGEWEEYINDVILSLERLKEWPLLLRILIRRREWCRLWEVVQAHPQAWQRGHDYELVASMARDMETNWDELRWKLPGLRDFLQEVVSSVRGEHAWWLQPLEVGLAYERLGCYRDALRFYERFAENRIGRIPRWQRSQIRQRWLLVHKKYRDSLQAEGRPTDLLAEEFSRAQERWREQLPQAEPELEEWDPWPHDFVEHPSPVQSWLLQREQTEAQRLQVAIREELKRLNERQLQQVHSLIQRLLGPG